MHLTAQRKRSPGRGPKDDGRSSRGRQSPQNTTLNPAWFRLATRVSPPDVHGVPGEPTGSTRIRPPSTAPLVQHALDYTLGAQSTREMSRRGMEALAQRTGRTVEDVAEHLTLPESDWINDWWHRRVFTRLIKNIHEGNYGLDYLKPRIDEVHELYQEIGGTLTLDEIISRTWEGVY